MHEVHSPLLFGAAVSAALLLAFSRGACAQESGERPPDESRPLPSIAEHTAGMERRAGLIPLWIDVDRGRALLELERFGEELLLVESLAGGLGSPVLGLDRGLVGPTRLVRFERRGRRALLVERNLRYRSSSGGEAAGRAIDDSFAAAALAALPVVAATEARCVVDATPLLVRDALGAVRALELAGEGAYELDTRRSAPLLEAARAFPRNAELEAALTFGAKAQPGAEARREAADGRSFTLRQRISFLALPDGGYRPRAFDPRFGSYAIDFADHAQPLDAPLLQRWIVRHRLEKRDRAAARSPVVRPIVYYVDRAAPPEVREALIDGARWWSAAFEAAGYLDAFRVEEMPPEMDPSDARYHVILWIHRAARGWSYGSTVIDPRTGEILRGVVRLGSQRARHDVLLFRGLLGASADEASPSGHTRAVDLALARLRQLSAHEVGHTLGFVHNFAASAQGRSSVMDYPAPRIALRADSSFDLSQAYAEGIGAWDLHAVEAAYRDFGPDTDENAELDRIARAARDRGLRILSEDDARPEGSMHPQAILWDNAEDGLGELRQAVAVRSAALARFSAEALPLQRPAAELEEILLPLYLHHRYALEGAAKLIGGADYSHALRGDGTAPPRAVSAGLQRGALHQMLATLRPEFLRLPAGLIALLPPRPTELAGSGETFPRRTAPAFDALAPAELSAERTLALLLHPARLARVLDQHAADAQQLTLEELLAELLRALEPRDLELEREEDRQILRLLHRVFVERCIALAADATARGDVRAMAEEALQLLNFGAGEGAVAGAHFQWLRRKVQRFLERRDGDERAGASAPLPLPAGAPIGCGCGEH